MSFNNTIGTSYGNYGISSGQGSSRAVRKGSLSTSGQSSSTARVDSFEHSAESLSGLDNFGGFGIFQNKGAGQFADLLASAGLSPVTNSGNYGSTVGEPELSEEAQSYYDSLKEKFGDMEFVLVSNDKMEEVKANAANYGTQGKTVVLISEENVEKMAADPAYREKYEGIISNAQDELKALAESLKDNPNVKSLGMMIDGEGNTSYFALFEEGQKAAGERMEEIREKKRAEKAAEEKKAEKKEKEKRAEKKEAEKRAEKEEEAKKAELRRAEKAEAQNSRYTLYSAKSVEELLAQIPARKAAAEAGTAAKAEGGAARLSITV